MVAGGESNTAQFNDGMQSILTQAAQVQLSISCGFVSNSIAQSAAIKMAIRNCHDCGGSIHPHPLAIHR